MTSLVQKHACSALGYLILDREVKENNLGFGSNVSRIWVGTLLKNTSSQIVAFDFCVLFSSGLWFYIPTISMCYEFYIQGTNIIFRIYVRLSRLLPLELVYLS